MAAMRDDADREGDFQRLFESWRKLILMQDQNPAKADAPEAPEPASTVDPWILADTAARRPAENDRDLLFKLAFWRWANPTLGPSFDKLSSHDAVLYSLFRDLVDRTGEDGVLTEFDKKTDLMRNVVSDVLD